MKQFFFFFVLISTLFFLGCSAFLVNLIFVTPGDHLDEQRIKQSVLTESTLYYRDGKTKLGALYSEAHREYLLMPDPLSISMHPVSTIPPLFLKAIVASEDQNFFNHIGISPSSILRAAIANLKARKVVQGGSTLSQQTAEILFNHKATDEWGKWKEKVLETLDAFRLETRYSKDQILEFYTNLFHVHGTGQGLAIAARYYFDKRVSELNLSEIAFIAGSVKGPANYTPFGVDDPQLSGQIIEKATGRRNYVLNNMRLKGVITAREYELATAHPVVFRQGDFRFEESHQMDAALKVLQSEPWKSMLLEKGISDLRRAEVNIYTTLDADLSRIGEFALKRHLSKLEFLIAPYTHPAGSPLSEKIKPEINKFYVGTILKVEADASSSPPKVTIRLGADQGVVQNMNLDSFVQHVLNPSGTDGEGIAPSHYQKALSILKPGDPILVSTLQKRPDGEWDVAIEQEPRLNGGVFILQEGEVRAMVGGFHNYGFNRALQAKRQPGSTFKLPVYLTALQLGWNPLDVLPNERRIYPFQGQYYFPRPDHTPPASISSIVWAGVKSENLASVYLLAHLLDHLDLEQFTRLIRFSDLGRKREESLQDYRYRLRDDHGIFENEAHMLPGIFAVVQKRLKNEFLMDEFSEEAQIWDRLHYGQGWEKAHKAWKRNKRNHRTLKGEHLEHNFLRFEKIAKMALEKLSLLNSYWDGEGTGTATTASVAEDEITTSKAPNEDTQGKDHLFNGFYMYQPDKKYESSGVKDSFASSSATDRFIDEGVHLNGTSGGRDSSIDVPLLAFSDSENSLPPEWKPLDHATLQVLESKLKLRLQDQQNKPGNQWKQILFRPDNIRIEGKIRLSILTTTRDLMKQHLEEMKRFHSYAPQRLYYHHDFRITLALHTVIKLSKILGIQSELRPVLSFPLGSNEVTLDELALMYQSFVSGQIMTRAEMPWQNTWKLIDRIEDSKGNIIYQEKLVPKRILDEETRHVLREILRNVVEHGTGRRVKPYLVWTQDLDGGAENSHHTLRLPAYGKTGTANNYSNATYVGFLPAIQDDGVAVPGGYTISTYIGLDRQDPDAEPLPFRLTGSSGGLPVWGEIARQIIRSPAYKNKLQWLSLTGEDEVKLTFPNPENFTLNVSTASGLPLSQQNHSFASGATSVPNRRPAIVHLPRAAAENRRVNIFKELKGTEGQMH